MIFVFIFMLGVESKIANEKVELCKNVQCVESGAVCGIREEGTGYRLRVFDTECDLVKYGCQVADNLVYGLITMDYCDQALINSSTQNTEKLKCTDYDCTYPTDKKEVCGIRRDGSGFRIRVFENKCVLWEHNCKTEIPFSESEFHLCSSLDLGANSNTDVFEKHNDSHVAIEVIKNNNVVVVDSSMINFNNVNESIDKFFAATHIFDLPMKEVHRDVNETTRRMLIKIFGPAKVFRPWITIPKNISDDYEYRPTLSSCYHKCPRKCPDTYAPVCGVPGIVAREPNLMFQNHCFMDVAQCKMYWEDKSPTAISSNYIESSFLFCLGDELNGLYRFLPLIRTLQHMGRLKKKGHFRYKLKNLRFFNNLLAREPKLMG